MLRMRKELIQSRSRVADLQDELQEKTSHFLRAVKVSLHFAVSCVPIWRHNSLNRTISNYFIWYWCNIWRLSRSIWLKMLVEIGKRRLQGETEQCSRKHRQLRANRCPESQAGSSKRAQRHGWDEETERKPQESKWHARNWLLTDKTAQ